MVGMHIRSALRFKRARLAWGRKMFTPPDSERYALSPSKMVWP